VPVLTVVTLGLVVLCPIMVRAWKPPVFGQGPAEFTRLLRAMGAAAIVLGLSGLALKLSELQPSVFGVIPIACRLAALSGLILRKVLLGRRAEGQCLYEVPAVGSAKPVADLIILIRRASHQGRVVSAAGAPSGTEFGGENTILDIRGVPAARPALPRKLVARPRRPNSLADHRRGRARYRCLLILGRLR
jgi:hypothetical protein